MVKIVDGFIDKFKYHTEKSNNNIQNELDDPFLSYALKKEIEWINYNLKYIQAEVKKQPEQITSLFIKFLNTYWDKIKNTKLSHTALPHHPITQLCVEIAKLLNSIDPSKTDFQYLMPTVTKTLIVPISMNKRSDDRVHLLEESLCLQNFPLAKADLLEKQV